MTGTIVRIKGIKRYRHPKTGIVYTYHRASGKPIKAEFGTLAFLAELAALDSETERRHRPKPVAGTVGGLFDVYRQSATFLQLKPRVRKGYEDAISFILGNL